jgi:hypothetical protein
MYVSIKDYSLFQSVYSIKTDIIKKNKKLQNKLFYFKYKTIILEDNKTLYDYKIKKDEQLEVIFKSEGGTQTLSKGLLIFIWVIIFLFYFLFLIMGLIPFISFIIPNIIVKGLSKLVNFFYELTHPNNFMNSVFYFLKTYIIPFFDFIFGYFGLFIFVYIITFFSTYHMYYYAKKENVCDAFKTTRVVSLITSFLTTIFYFIANTSSIFRILAGFIPQVIRKPFLNAANIISNLRLSFAGMVPYIGKPQVSFVECLLNLFKGIGYLKLFGNQLLDNPDIAMELIKTNDARKFTQEQGIDDIIKYIRVIEKAESHYANGIPITAKNKKNAEEMKEIFPSVSPAAGAYFIRSVFFNFLKIIIDMSFFIDICNTNGEAERIKEEMKEEFLKMIELQKKGNLSDQQRKDKMQEFVEKIQSIKLDSIINIDCLMNTIINGVTFSSLYTFLFLIIFILFFFVKL